MTDSYRELTKSISTTLGKLRMDIPDTTRGFGALSKGAMAPGTIDAKTKELIATALSVGGRCDPCIGYHVESLVKLGATRAEFAEMLGVCVYMGGGPSLMYAAKAMQAFDEYLAEMAAG